MSDEYTYIRVKVKDRERLKALGKKGEAYSDILERILDDLERERETGLKKALSGESILRAIGTMG